jgi:CheY-like chemotaxis protein
VIRYGAGGRRILIVEDEPVICEICLKVLTGEGYEVEIAANGKEGDSKLRGKEYDLIIIDLRTPVMDGRQLYQRISEKYPDMTERVIMTSGEVVGSDMQSFLDKSGVAFLPKPFTSSELKKAVEGAFERIDR